MTPNQAGKMLGSSIESRSTGKSNVGILAVGILLAAFAFLTIAENDVMSADRQRLLSNKNHNDHKVTENVQSRNPRAPKMKNGDKRKLENNDSAKKSINKPNAAAVHEWKPSSQADVGTDADATERNLHRKCPPGVDSVTGSFCGLSYEQICCFCPQPLDCDNGCPADADGIVRDGCFHSITIPCPDVDCNIDQMTDRLVELGG